MPHFSAQIPNLQQVGPVVEIIISPSLTMVKMLGLTVKPEQHIKIWGMIDTGATGTVISQDVASKMGIMPISDEIINTPSSTNIRCLKFDVQITFPNNGVIPSFIVTAAPLQNQHIQCLIGRDILQIAQFVYSGFTNTFTLSF